MMVVLLYTVQTHHQFPQHGDLGLNTRTQHPCSHLKT
jgi:hypothetical protein